MWIHGSNETTKWWVRYMSLINAVIVPNINCLESHCFNLSFFVIQTDATKNEAIRKLSPNESHDTNGETGVNREMYENMPFQRKVREFALSQPKLGPTYWSLTVQNCMLSNGSHIPHIPQMPHMPDMPHMPHYNDNMAQLTRQLRRTQSARFNNHFQVWRFDNQC